MLKRYRWHSPELILRSYSDFRSSNNNVATRRPMTKPNVLTAAEAAREKDCSRYAIYDAIKRGDLNTVQVGGLRLISRDPKYLQYEVKETGARTHREK